MPVYQLSESVMLPRPDLAETDGLLAVGGDLSTERLILAYENGIFPWYNPDQPILWWSPPNRMVLYTGELKVRKSLRQSLRNKGFECRIDYDFKAVIEHCQRVKRKEEAGTWISQEIIDAYTELYSLGFAHSFEIWQNNRLVGGLYGVSLGRMFVGESMFSMVSDASKAAMYYLHEFCLKHEFNFIDCQLHTPHLESLGAREVPREEFLSALNTALAFPDLRGKWTLE